MAISAIHSVRNDQFKTKFILMSWKNGSVMFMSFFYCHMLIVRSIPSQTNQSSRCQKYKNKIKSNSSVIYWIVS